MDKDSMYILYTQCKVKPREKMGTDIATRHSPALCGFYNKYGELPRIESQNENFVQERRNEIHGFHRYSKVLDKILSLESMNKFVLKNGMENMFVDLIFEGIVLDIVHELLPTFVVWVAISDISLCEDIKYCRIPVTILNCFENVRIEDLLKICKLQEGDVRIFGGKFVFINNIPVLQAEIYIRVKGVWRRIEDVAQNYKKMEKTAKMFMTKSRTLKLFIKKPHLFDISTKSLSEKYETQSSLASSHSNSLLNFGIVNELFLNDKKLKKSITTSV